MRACGLIMRSWYQWYLGYNTAAMDRYKALKAHGTGRYGTVFKAAHRATGEIVAIKRMKRKVGSWDECMQLREVQSLRKLSHPHIVKLKEVIREDEYFYLVFEYLDQNLDQLCKARAQRESSFSESSVRDMVRQLLQALAYVHERGFFHRDVKPENILVAGASTLKLADFGVAREIRSRPPYTRYIGTRWYRAPELLLRATDYSASIDVWAVGTIMAELLALRPLFPGSTEADQIHRIAAVLGAPTAATWQQGIVLAQTRGVRFPKTDATPLAQLVPNASADALDLMSLLLRWDPATRPTAAQALRHPFLQKGAERPLGRMMGAAVAWMAKTGTHAEQHADSGEEAEERLPGGGDDLRFTDSTVAPREGGSVVSWLVSRGSRMAERTRQRRSVTENEL